ncbi:adaptor protein MecA [Lachnospiraceae bacterium OttesenSCG-928-D06]|nr:adaptor protein MecA [Lachnospiraceae bacterium OttesenSCG-928-D06]
MKIEKVNENQIRCTLTRDDLASRELKISELAYGTEKAKSLFRDMMQQANFEFGFEAEDIPLMIEAIPLNAECIVLIITKVEDPEELDTRFSRFAPTNGDDEYDDIDSAIESSDEVMDLFRKLHENRKSDTADIPVATSLNPGEDTSKEEIVNLTHIFRFHTLKQLITVSSIIAVYYQGNSTLYKDSHNDVYLLSVAQDDYDACIYNKVCNVLSEYGYLLKSQPTGTSYLEEHFEIIIPANAIFHLSQI